MKKACVFVLAAIAFLQCESSGDSHECSTPATVRNLAGLGGCSWVFELNDGTKLEPLRLIRCGTPPLPEGKIEDPLYNFEYVEGKKVLISFDYMDSVASACMVGPIVKITCLTELHALPEK